MSWKLKAGIKSRRAGQSFQDLYDYVPGLINPEGDYVYDISERKRTMPMTQLARNESYRNEALTYQAQDRTKSFAASDFARARRDKFAGLIAKHGADPEAIAHAMVNPAAVWAPAEAQPNLVIQTPQMGWVGDVVAPPIQSAGGKSSGLYYEWTPATTHRLYDNRIVKGQEPPEIEMQAVEYSYVTHEYALANRVYERDIANTATPLRLRDQASDALDNAMRLAREARVLNLAFSAAVPGVAAAAAWSAAGGGTPVTDILNGLIAIFNATQNDATHVVIPYQVALAMINTANWRLWFTWASIGQVGPLLGVQMALANFGLTTVFSRVCGLTTDQGTASDPNLFANIIGNQVLIFKQDPQPTNRSRCFMFAPYRIRDEVVSGKWDREVKTRSEYWQQYEDCTELLVDAASGYRITGV